MLEKIDSEKIAAISITLIVLVLILAVTFSVDDDIEFAKAGLEECLIKNIPTSNGTKYQTIWVKDCTKTLEAIQKNEGT